MTISLTARSGIADAVADLIRAVESLRRHGGSKSIGDQLHQIRQTLCARLMPSGESANLTRNADILDSQFSLAEKETLYDLWLSVRWPDLWATTIPRTPELVLAKLERILAGLRQTTAVPPFQFTASPGPATSTIWYHGDKSYSTTGSNPLAVSTEQHNLLKAFLDKEAALDTKTLRRAGVENVARTVSRLADKFGTSAVRRPARRGDGYFVRVRTLVATR
jgi:hypothetical protein